MQAFDDFEKASEVLMDQVVCFNDVYQKRFDRLLLRLEEKRKDMHDKKKMLSESCLHEDIKRKHQDNWKETITREEARNEMAETCADVLAGTATWRDEDV